MSAEHRLPLASSADLADLIARVEKSLALGIAHAREIETQMARLREMQRLLNEEIRRRAN